MNKRIGQFKIYAARVIIGIVAASSQDEYSQEVVDDGAQIVTDIYDAISINGVKEALGDWFETPEDKEYLYQSFIKKLSK